MNVLELMNRNKESAGAGAGAGVDGGQSVEVSAFVPDFICIAAAMDLNLISNEVERMYVPRDRMCVSFVY